MKRSHRIVLDYNPNLKVRARRLRKRMTEAEVVLWNHIRRKQIKGVQFFRQRPIGNYIVDFYAPDAALVIEVDGGQHYEDDVIEYDSVRDQFLEAQCLKVIRFTNTDVLRNIDEVVGEIMANIG
ncbi:endonuclease domain-containing protein [candidate division KSB1 bacterium]|nr:endonuclease domain-containing protein [candidate division KSB1 bacterium]